MIGIYVIENEVNNKKYVGKTIDYTRRVYLHTHYLRSHNHVNSYLQASWDKYGSENFKFYMLHDITDWSKDKSRLEIEERLNELEKQSIKQLMASDSRFGYNLSEGGDGATLFGERNPSYGKPKDLSTRQKISETIRKNKSHSGKNNGRYGKPVSDITRQKISIANKGRKQSEEEKLKRAESMEKWRGSNEYKVFLENRKNDKDWQKRCAENGKKRRKYTDEFVATVRKAYSENPNMAEIAKQFNLRYKLCVEMINRNGHFWNR